MRFAILALSVLAASPGQAQDGICSGIGGGTTASLCHAEGWFEGNSDCVPAPGPPLHAYFEEISESDVMASIARFMLNSVRETFPDLELRIWRSPACRGASPCSIGVVQVDTTLTGLIGARSARDFAVASFMPEVAVSHRMPVRAGVYIFPERSSGPICELPPFSPACSTLPNECSEVRLPAMDFDTFQREIGGAAVLDANGFIAGPVGLSDPRYPGPVRRIGDFTEIPAGTYMLLSD